MSSTFTDTLLPRYLRLRLVSPYVRPVVSALYSHAFCIDGPRTSLREFAYTPHAATLHTPRTSPAVLHTQPDFVQKFHFQVEPAACFESLPILEETTSVTTDVAVPALIPTSVAAVALGIASPMTVVPRRVAATPCTIPWQDVVDICCEVYADHGPDCSERVYQDAVFYKLYTLGVPSIRERNLFVETAGVFSLRGRIDLEIGSKFLLEFKISPPTSNNIHVHTQQLKRYLRTYEQNGQTFEKSAVVYFFGGQVRVVDVSTVIPKKGRYTPY
jgi:PD-(D/E)XK nuclease superfamily